MKISLLKSVVVGFLLSAWLPTVCWGAISINVLKRLSRLFALRALLGLGLLCPSIVLAASPQTEYYPIIFIHGHSGGVDVENTWVDLINTKLKGQNGYNYYGKIWSDSVIQEGLSPRTIFAFGFYRSNADKAFGEGCGRIGAIPEGYTGSRDYYERGGPRCEYAARLSNAVEKVLLATHSSKVIIVAHSMGGLVARAYVRWAGGEDKVYKLLTVATPNKGIPDDVRNTLAQFVESFGHADWQVGGEYEEMSKAVNFSGHSYTHWLNENWKEYCNEHSVRYATIRGNYCPFIDIIHIGDGVVDEADATLDGAEFNGVVYAAHIDDFGVPVLCDTYPRELSLPSSTYTAEVIKRWIFEDRVHTNGNFVKYSSSYFMYAPNPFNNEILYDYELNGYAVYASLFIHSITGDRVATFGIPLYPGINQPVFDLNYLANGVYFYYLHAYDMNGKILDESGKIAKMCCDSGRELPERPAFSIRKAPNSTSSDCAFTVSSTINGGTFTYKLDDQPWTSYTTNNSITVRDLSEGVHTIYASGIVPHYGYPEEPAVYRWIVSYSHPIDPAWWIELNVVDATVPVDDYAAANVGQLKSIAQKACQAMNAHLSGGAGAAITNMVNGFTTNDDYAVANVGQVKQVAKPFYDRLGMAYSWSASDDDYAVVNVGQLKYLFSFEID